MRSRRPHRTASASDDRAVSEVIGFIMMFALSAMILVFTMRAFDTTHARTREASAGVQLQSVADRVSSRVVQAGLVAERFPNATFVVDVDLPAAIEGFGYTVTGTNQTVFVNSTDGQVETNSTTFETEAINGVWIHGTVYSGPYDLEVRYLHENERATATKDILLREGGT
jgi:FlaG/FlaF family flagellin (archaellin)